MKNIKLSGLCVVFAVAFLLATSGAVSAATIALWNYNTQPVGTSYTTGQGEQFPSPDLGSGTQGNVGTMTWGYNGGSYPTSPAGSGDYPSPPGDPATGQSDVRYRAVDQAAGEGLQWTVSTEGYQDIQVQLGVFTSVNFPGSGVTFSFDYYNNELTWIEATTPIYDGTNTWATFYLSPGVDANDLSSFAFRLLLDSGSAGGITYDWVEVTGTPVPIPAAAWLLGSGLIGLIGLRRRFK